MKAVSYRTASRKLVHVYVGGVHVGRIRQGFSGWRYIPSRDIAAKGEVYTTLDDCKRALEEVVRLGKALGS